MTNRQLRNHISQQCGFNKTQPQCLLESIIPNKAVQVCNAGDWPEYLPSSFEDWLKSNNDSIDIGGNEIPSRVQANLDRYDNERHPFA